MDYKELINKLRNKDGCNCECLQAGDAIETLLAERDAAVWDLTEVCEENPDACQYCKHMPCAEPYGRCVGWEWKGMKTSEGGQNEENHLF